MKLFLHPILTTALESIGAPSDVEIVLEQPRQAEHGDIATGVALGLARVLKRSPREVAESIVAAMQVDERYVAGIDIAGPGFINVRFTPEFFLMRLEEMWRLGEGWGRSDEGKGITTNVEYVSANPTGPLHTGHGRGAALGDTIANILAWRGYDVTREYYFNNAGNQMRNLALSIHARYLQALGHDAPMPEGGYQGEYITEIARELLASRGEELIEPTPENIETIRNFGEGWCFARIKRTMESLGILHDTFFNEDSLYKDGKITETLDDLARIGVTYEKDGAIWLRLSDHGLQDRVIVRANGEPTYRLPDIAYHREKFRRGFELIVDIFGADHIATIADVKAALAMLGHADGKIRVVLNQMVSFIEGGEQVKMSKRTGKSLTLDDLIDELGADVVRFFFVMRGASSHLEFDLDLAREQSNKNPVFYLQYAHARIAGVLRHAETEGIPLRPDASLDPLGVPEELDLIREILRFPESLERAARELEPQVVAEYLRDLAAAFHKFYHECRIVVEAPPLRDARMRLLAAAKITLANGLQVLGVSAPERM